MMDQAYHGVTQLFFQLSNLFFWPVAITLLLLFVVVLADLGALFAEWLRRRRQSATNIARVAQTLAGDLSPAALDGFPLSPAVQRFWQRVSARLAAVGVDEDLDLWLEESLQHEEMAVTNRLDRSRALVRIGPMLGLAGTIIPLGPALQSLLTGNMAGMVDHLVVGFGAVVCGLMMSGVSYFITLLRERWARVELKEMENLCELLLRNIQRANAKKEHRYARVSA